MTVITLSRIRRARELTATMKVLTSSEVLIGTGGREITWASTRAQDDLIATARARRPELFADIDAQLRTDEAAVNAYWAWCRGDLKDHEIGSSQLTRGADLLRRERGDRD